MTQKTIIIKNATTKVKIYSNYMVVTSKIESSIISFRHIDTLYINKTIPITPSQLIKMASYFSIYFIDTHGHILATIRLENDET